MDDSLSYPVPDNEAERLQALYTYAILDTLPEAVFDDVVGLASSICGTPIALISLLDSDRQWFKAKVGIEAEQTARSQAFCSHAIMHPDDVFVVPDARQDERFKCNPLVEGEPRIRFYAGASIMTPDGYALGTVCAIDREPRELTASQQLSMAMLARLVGHLLHCRWIWREQVGEEVQAA
ncbi:MAG: GAF domain-containing protein [Burkholderiales bacterium]